ncbi:MAG: ABC transporter permease [Cytophagales bacterium]|nr:MAG: ABC transporter permease [Cytophagales bacterium]
MKKIWLVIQREYLVRIRKRAFIIMTLLTPVLFAALMIIPVWLATTFESKKTIQVIDQSGIFEGKNKIADKDNLKFFYANEKKNLKEAKEELLKENTPFHALLFIPENMDINNPQGIELYSPKNISFDTQLDIEKSLREIVEYIRISKLGIDIVALQKTKAKVNINTINLSETGEEKDSNSAIAFIISLVTSFIIYIAIFLYGSQVMRSVGEEKANRIVEVMISSIKPFELMMGKIIGVALIGLTQFLLWIVLTIGISSLATSSLINPKDIDKVNNTTTLKDDAQTKAITEKMNDNAGANKILNALSTLNYPLIIGSFLFYFLGGYLLYSAMFAAVASAVDSETDIQQFVAPVSAPLIFAIITLQFVAREPQGVLAFWLSIIPFTSPIIMMTRIPFGVSTWELVLSMSLLVVGFVFITWLAARIYRIGILMYGKKVTFKEIGKWMFYKA